MNVMDRNNLTRGTGGKLNMNDFQFHLGEETLRDGFNAAKHSSSAAIACLTFPPVRNTSPTNIFLANFPKSWNECDLAHIFEGIPIFTVHIIRDRIGPNSGIGVSRGVGFVNVAYNHEAVALVKHLDRKIWLEDEAPLKIRLAKATAPPPKVDVDVHGMAIPSSKPRDLVPRRKGPKINLLTELLRATSATNWPVDVVSSFKNPSLANSGLRNMFDLPALELGPKFDHWPKYSRLANPLPSSGTRALHRPLDLDSNLLFTVQKIDPAGLALNCWELWPPKKSVMSSSSDSSLFRSGRHVRADANGDFIHAPMNFTFSPLLTSKTTEYSRNNRAHSLVYGFIGGPAIDITSGTVISPRRHKSIVSPNSNGYI